MTRTLEFGIYPLGVAGTPEGLAIGPPDDYATIRARLAELGGGVVPRTYLVDMKPGGEDAVLDLADRYHDAGLLGHVSLGCLRDHDFSLDRWTKLVREVVARHGGHLRSIQITNEPNLSFMDGSRPFVLDALVDGVLAAKDEARRRSLEVDVGFGSVPQSAVALPTFWKDLGARIGPEFLDAVDFVGHNFYVDVFEEPMALSAIPPRIEQVLRDIRARDLPSAGLAEVPIRVTENGWPTGTNPLSGAVRSHQHQAAVVDSVVRTIHRLSSQLDVTHYMLFGLRDADSSKSDPFHQFGILHDDYTRKPAFDTFRTIVAELGPTAPP